MDWFMFLDVIAWIFAALYVIGILAVLCLKGVAMRTWGFVAGVVSIAYLTARFMS